VSHAQLVQQYQQMEEAVTSQAAGPMKSLTQMANANNAKMTSWPSEMAPNVVFLAKKPATLTSRSVVSDSDVATDAVIEAAIDVATEETIEEATEAAAAEEADAATLATTGKIMEGTGTHKIQTGMTKANGTTRVPGITT